MNQSKNQQRVFIVIPAYNEEKSIGAVLQGLRKYGYQNLIVINDCSHDNTAARAKQAGAMVLNHIINIGQGAALKTGIDYAVQEGADIIVTFDADGQHDPQDIPMLLEPILKGKAEITLGSRFLKSTSQVPLLKRIVLKGGILFTWLCSGIMLTDTHNGLRAMSRKAAQQLQLRQNRMAHASEIIDEIHRKRIPFKEVPVTIRYTKYAMAKGQSVFNAFDIAFKMIIRKLVR
ncbi:glycosyltransferase family 2 protein [Candidatus Woesearchaeota archaeon]|nr:glycosyltransferase family 2 protein [Candidatus Woesearchaeota archaeon]